MPLFEENLHPAAQNLVIKKLHSTLSYGENPESLFHLGLNWYQAVMDRWIDRRKDRIMMASMHLALHAVVHKNSAK